MADRHPGMPPAPGDPGFFICGPADIAPWETEPTPRPQRPGSSRPAPGGYWLVLRLCQACGPAYCRDHAADNWWLENFRPR